MVFEILCLLTFDAFQRKHRATRYNSVVDFQKNHIPIFRKHPEKKGVSEIQPQRNSTVTGSNNSKTWHNRAGAMEEEIRDVKDVYFTTKDLRDNR